jgi:hypothetical protein
MQCFHTHCQLGNNLFWFLISTWMQCFQRHCQLGNHLFWFAIHDANYFCQLSITKYKLNWISSIGFALLRYFNLDLMLSKAVSFRLPPFLIQLYSDSTHLNLVCVCQIFVIEKCFTSVFLALPTNIIQSSLSLSMTKHYSLFW